MLLRRHGLNYALKAYVLDLSAVLIALLIARQAHLVYPLTVSSAVPPSSMIVIGAILLAVWSIVAFTLAIYDPTRTLRAVDELGNTIKAALFFLYVLAGALYFTEPLIARGFFAYYTACALALILGWRAVLRLVFRVTGLRRYPPRRVIVVGVTELGQQAAEMVRRYSWTGLEFLGFVADHQGDTVGADVPVLGTLDSLPHLVESENVEEVLIALKDQSHQSLKPIVVRLLTLPVNIRVVPDYLSLSLYRATIDRFGKERNASDIEDIDGLLLINLRAPVLETNQYLLKRIVDLVVATFATVLALPLLAIVALAVKLDSPGPVIFSQERVGENGRLFTMHKFRSMYADAEARLDDVIQYAEDGSIIHKVPNDPRVTRVGRWIRPTSIDELPQLFNVLKGDMSLVGPRPELPMLVDTYETWQYTRFAVPQGITGWWQVNGRSSKLMHLHTEYDLYYVHHYSFWLDLIILLRTPLAVIRHQGAF